MSVCPKCGWEDSPCWRNARFYMYCSTCRIEELDTWEPEVAKRLRETTPIEIPPFHYKVTKLGWVYRTPIKLKDFLYNRKAVEGVGRFQAKKNKHDQKKLLEVTK